MCKMSFYTHSGQKIHNPEAYAKTGAPMYKTKYTESQNINEKTYIYKLDLENGKKYIGKTNNVDSLEGLLQETYNDACGNITMPNKQ